jgi:hypothetical protein
MDKTEKRSLLKRIEGISGELKAIAEDIKSGRKRRRNECCERTLLEMGKVIGAAGITLTASSCRDGDTVICKTCGRELVHVCDEAEGCYWEARKKCNRIQSRKQTRSRKPQE